MCSSDLYTKVPSLLPMEFFLWYYILSLQYDHTASLCYLVNFNCYVNNNFTVLVLPPLMNATL